MLNGFYKIHQTFQSAELDDPLMETLRLLDILTNGAVRKLNDGFLTESKIDLNELVAKRLQGIPLEYALGRTTFMGLEFCCTPGALIPREETELLGWTALNFISEMTGADSPLVIDMGTGSGNLAVSLAMHAPMIKVLASDISAEAVDVARQHVEKYDLNERVTLFCGNMFEKIREAGFSEAVDMIVCNPPYIPSASLEKMDPQVINHEPVAAFDAGAYGIDIFRKLIAESPEFLKPGGRLVFEIGEGQEKIVKRLLEKSGHYEDIGFHEDGEGKVRVLSCIKNILDTINKAIIPPLRGKTRA